jgi:adenylate cyclase
VIEGAGPNVGEIGVGVGIDSGEVRFGEFGRSHRDLTAIGNIVNTAARTQSAAEAGQILVTRAVYDRAPRQTAERQGREFRLKGFEKPVELYAI